MFLVGQMAHGTPRGHQPWLDGKTYEEMEAFSYGSNGKMVELTGAFNHFPAELIASKLSDEMGMGQRMMRLWKNGLKIQLYEICIPCLGLHNP